MTPEGLKEFRERRGLSAAQLARILNVTPRLINHYEAGTRRITERTASQLKRLRISSAKR